MAARHPLRCLAGTLALASLFGAPAIAQADDDDDEPEVTTDRPDVSNSTYITPRGYTQVELGHGMTYTNGRAVTVRAPFVLRTGLAKPIELRLGGDVVIWKWDDQAPRIGQGDLFCGFKLRFWEEGKYNPSVGIEPILVLPTANSGDGLGSGRPVFNGTVAISKSFPHGFSADANIVANALGVQGRRGEYFPQGLLSLSLGKSWVDGKVTTFWEIYGLTPDAPGNGDVVSTDFGVIVQVHKRVALDWSADVGITDAAPRYQGNVGISMLFGPYF